MFHGHMLARPYVLSAFALLLVACNSDVSAPTDNHGLKPGTPSGMVVCDDGSTCDGNYNPNDSQLSGNIGVSLTTYVHSDEAFEDPATGQTVNDITVQSPVENLSFHAGYDYSGNPVVQTGFIDGADATGPVADQVTGMAVVGNNVSSKNSYGQIVDEPTPPEANGETSMDFLGDMTGASVTDNVVTSISADNTPEANINVPRTGDPNRATTAAPRGAASTIVERIGADTLRLTLALPQEVGEPAITQIKTFHKEGLNWVLNELRVNSEETDGPRRIKQVHVLAFTNLTWFQNELKNAERRMKRPTNEVIPLSGSTASNTLVRSNSLSAPTGPRKMVSCDALPPDDPNYCGSGGSPPPPPPPGGTPPGWDAGVDIAGCYIPNGYMFNHEPSGVADLEFGGYDQKNIWGNVHPDGTNIVFQHGILSSASTWCDMERYLRTNVRIGWEARFSLHSLATYEDQATDLLSRVNQTRGGAGPVIFIGHSNGGIVSRQLAHNVGGDPSLIGGVLTIDSPHGGAPISLVSHAAAAAALAPIGMVAGCNRIIHKLCSALPATGPMGFVAAILAGTLAFNGTAPVAPELHPRSTYRGTLNNPAETFPRAGIQSQSWDKWTEWRLYGDAHCLPYAQCGGRGWVKFIDHEYHYAIKCAVVGALTGFFWHGAWAVAAGCAKVAAQVKGYDAVFKRLTVAGDHGDGIVPMQSQLYPNVGAERQFTIGDGDSHVGVLRGTDFSGPKIVTALNRYFGVPVR